MPSELLPGQSLSHLPGGGMRIEGFDYVTDELRFLIGQYTEHVLRVDRISIPLGYGAVTFRLREAH